MQPTKKLGNRGEQLAQIYLEKKGLLFLESNFYAQTGEIDLIMYDKKEKEYVLIEVKTRSSQEFGYIEETITHGKYKRIIKAAAFYFFVKRKMPEMPYFRIDIVFVEELKNKTLKYQHLENIGEDDF